MERPIEEKGIEDAPKGIMGLDAERTINNYI